MCKGRRVGDTSHTFVESNMSRVLHNLGIEVIVVDVSKGALEADKDTTTGMYVQFRITGGGR